MKTKLFKMIILPTIVAMVICILLSVSACNDAYIVQHNIKNQADKFDTYRLVTVINLRSDKVLLEVEGYISIQDSTDNELAIIIQTGKSDYKMHYVYLAPEVVYLVQQIENTYTDPYHWDIRIHAVIPTLN